MRFISLQCVSVSTYVAIYIIISPPNGTLSEVADLISNEYYKDSYIKTHMRFSAYMVGLLTGYVVHRMQANR